VFLENRLWGPLRGFQGSRSLIRVDVPIESLFGCLPEGVISSARLRQGRKFTRGNAPAFGKNRVLSPVESRQPHGSVIAVECNHLFI
jgi:hypothetical protein